MCTQMIAASKEDMAHACTNCTLVVYSKVCVDAAVHVSSSHLDQITAPKRTAPSFKGLVMYGHTCVAENGMKTRDAQAAAVCERNVATEVVCVCVCVSASVLTSSCLGLASCIVKR